MVTETVIGRVGDDRVDRFFVSQTFGGIGPMIPSRFRVGTMYTATEWVIVRACSADLWQFRSTMTISSFVTLPKYTILFAVDVPFVTK